MKELEKYDIPADQIYTITTDNGANRVKAVYLIEDCNQIAEANSEWANENEVPDSENDVDNHLMDRINSCDWSAHRIMSK